MVILPRQLWCEFTDRNGIVELVGLGRNIEPGTWSQVQGMVDAFSHFATARKKNEKENHIGKKAALGKCCGIDENEDIVETVKEGDEREEF